jgi:hypothetical protein
MTIKPGMKVLVHGDEATVLKKDVKPWYPKGESRYWVCDIRGKECLVPDDLMKPLNKE